MNSKLPIKISGYPRSGTTYLNSALHLLYDNTDDLNITRVHTALSIENNKKIFIPYRNPLDAIASWHLFPSEGDLSSDIKFYIRIHSAVLKNIDNVILMDFDYFTKDIEYIKNKVFQHFNIDTNSKITDVEIKEIMLANGRDINLPRDNAGKLEEIKKDLSNYPKFDECVMLYNQVKNAEQSIN